MSSQGRPRVVALDWHRRWLSHQDATAKVLDAATALLREGSVAELSIDTIADRAGMSPSAAAELFPSVDDVIVDICLHRIHSVVVDQEAPAGSVERVSAQLTSVIHLVAEEPAVAAACASLFLETGSAAERARDQIGREISQLIASASGPGAWPEVRTTLELAFTGALIQAAMGSMPYPEAAQRVEDAVNLLLDAPSHHDRRA
ncbi:MAG: TetR/AcrR family transcriptional regulator [Mycobacterium kyogaense]|uniref:TetR/AcrR family transcriptional regulator n=1 Tax=Mycobacterium kyogaense TaxID=2212479 RepID=UPI002FFC1D07